MRMDVWGFRVHSRQEPYKCDEMVEGLKALRSCGSRLISFRVYTRQEIQKKGDLRLKVSGFTCPPEEPYKSSLRSLASGLITFLGIALKRKFQG